MNIFKKKEEKKECCCKDVNSENMEKAESVKSEKGLKVLGSGCAKCQSLEKAARTAIDELGLDLTIEHVTDFAQIASYGVMSTPALVLDGKVVSFGKVLSVDEVKAILSQE